MRIPILFGVPPRSDDAVLVEDGQNMPQLGHIMGFSRPKPRHGLWCTCCTLRGPVADALAQLFRARATGAAPFFQRVVVLASPEGETAVREALEDVMVAARYRL
jgi:hypothetical protein